MSVDLGVYVVDWDACLSLLKEADDFEQVWERLAEERIDLEYEPFDGLQRFSDYYDLCKQKGLKTWMPAFEEALNVVCWAIRDDRKPIQNLGLKLDPDEYPIDSSWSPVTTQRLRDGWLAASLTDFEPLEIEDGGFDFQAFTDYHRDWASVFDKACSANKGILVAVWG